MKINDLIEKADSYLNSENHKRKAKIEHLKLVLHKLKKREKKLEKQYVEGKRTKETMSKEIAIIHAHRKKGLDMLRQLQTEYKETSSSKEVKKEINDIDE